MANERLYQFPSKATPVPADIIFAGNSASAFDEVNITIAALIGAYPNLSGIGALTLSANTFIYSNNTAVLTAGSFSPLAVTLVGGTTVSSMQGTLGYTSTPSASLFAGWDGNSNLRANSFLSGYTTTTTAGGTTTLTVASTYQQYFTGTLNQTIAMPITSTLVLGQAYLIENISSGTLTVNSSGGNLITTVGANSSTRITCILTSGTTASSWSAATPVAGAGVVNSGTINNLAYYAANGSTVSSLATAASGFLITSAGGVPSISSTVPAFTVPGITFNSTTGLVGTTTNDSAAALSVGEFVTASGSSVAIVSATQTTVTSISLTAGDWDLWGNISTNPGAGTTQTVVACGISTVADTLPGTFTILPVAFTAGVLVGTNAPSIRLSLAATTTVYLVASVTYAVNTLTISGSLNARRRR